MPSNRKVVEVHGCIVCGKLYELLVVYAPDGHMVDCTVTSPGGRRVTDAERPLVACNRHSAEQTDKALARHYPGKEENEED
jgi:hypothetical protein